ncbi:DUF6083 domain-containing protein [Streptomyces sp. NPDC058664]|uniref:DUF6083 domain-containing protein n=1 Tax=unclassified Streptomyces TaxID=2593676 RepID=UPI0036691086
MPAPVRSGGVRGLGGVTIAGDSPSRLLRSAQPSRCRECGNRIDRHATSGHQHVGLHPAEMPSALAPARHRWHLVTGVAHPCLRSTSPCTT